MASSEVASDRYLGDTPYRNLHGQILPVGIAGETLEADVTVLCDYAAHSM